jgi:hypothetical protein
VVDIITTPCIFSFPTALLDDGKQSPTSHVSRRLYLLLAEIAEAFINLKDNVKAGNGKASRKWGKKKSHNGAKRFLTASSSQWS